MTAPAAEGVRVAYDATPAVLRAWVDSALGAPVIATVTQAGGFSPGVAARLECADGRRAFCKAVTNVNAFAADAHRREQRITAALPPDVPAPRLLASYDDGDWVALLLDDIDGRQAAATGDTLLHLDLRADNLLVTPERVWVVDWPHAARGAAVFDVVALAPSVAMQGGPDPETLLSLTAKGRQADRGVLTALVCALAGFFVISSLAPPPPGLPTVRTFQAAQGEVALRWLAGLTGWA